MIFNTYKNVIIDIFLNTIIWWKISVVSILKNIWRIQYNSFSWLWSFLGGESVWDLTPRLLLLSLFFPPFLVLYSFKYDSSQASFHVCYEGWIDKVDLLHIQMFISSRRLSRWTCLWVCPRWFCVKNALLSVGCCIMIQRIVSIPIIDECCSKEPICWILLQSSSLVYYSSFKTSYFLRTKLDS